LGGDAGAAGSVDRDQNLRESGLSPEVGGEYGDIRNGFPNVLQFGQCELFGQEIKNDI
jgi:hypothetical protein